MHKRARNTMTERHPTLTPSALALRIPDLVAMSMKPQRTTGRISQHYDTGVAKTHIDKHSIY